MCALVERLVGTLGLEVPEIHFLNEHPRPLGERRLSEDIKGCEGGPVQKSPSTLAQEG